MTRARRWQCLCATGLGLAMSAVTGCQTHVISTGLTLPSGHYLEHPPQYFPPDPDFPLQRELNTQLTQAAAATAANPPGLAGPLPPPAVPIGPGARPEAPGVPGVAPVPLGAPPQAQVPPIGR
jgi:hypothetical protein